MKLRVKRNDNVVELPRELYDKLSIDQKMAYEILNKDDAQPAKEQKISNEVKSSSKQPPSSGEKAKDTSAG